MREKNASSMTAAVKELAAIAASVSAHCPSCLEFHVQAARDLGVTEADIRDAIDVGYRVESGATQAMKQCSAQALSVLAGRKSCCGANAGQSGTTAASGICRTVLRIYDPALCCPSGVCGTEVDPVLVQFFAVVKQVAARPGICVERYNLAQHAQAFEEQAAVKALLADGGEKKLPFIFINEQLWCAGRYPSAQELDQALPLADTAAKPATSSCCGGAASAGCC